MTIKRKNIKQRVQHALGKYQQYDMLRAIRSILEKQIDKVTIDIDSLTTTVNTNTDNIANNLASITTLQNEFTESRVPVGGTAGQVLTKSSGTNYDYTWVDIPQGSDTVAGGVEVATLAEVQANTAIGSTGASLIATPDVLNQVYQKNDLTQNYIWVGNASNVAEEVETNNVIFGTATLVAGTVDITDAEITTGSTIIITPTITGTLTGTLRVSVNTGSITVESRDASNIIINTDTVEFNYMIKI